MVCCPHAGRPQTSWNVKVDDADCYLLLPPTNQKAVHDLITPPLNHYKPHYPLQVGTHSSGSINLLWSPLPGKAIQLFFLTSPKIQSPRFNLGSGYRGWIWLHWVLKSHRQKAMLGSRPQPGSPVHGTEVFLLRWVTRETLSGSNRKWSNWAGHPEERVISSPVYPRPDCICDTRRDLGIFYLLHLHLG